MIERSFNENVLIVTVLAASLSAALFAPTRYIMKSNKVLPTNDHETIQDLGFYDLKPSDGILTYEIFFERENIDSPLHHTIEYSTTVELYDLTHNKHIKKFDGVIYPVIPNRKSVVTGPHRLFIDQSIHYTNNYIQIRIGKLSDDIKSITIVGKHGNAKYNAYKLYIRVAFSILSLIEIVKILLKKSQKETRYVLYFLFLLLAMNPLMIIHYFYPMRILVFLDNISQALFDSFSRFFFLSLLSSMRGSLNSQLSIVFFFIIYLLTKIFHYLSLPLADVGFFTAVSTQSMPILSFELGLEMTFLTWVIVAFASSYSKSKTTLEKSVVRQFYFICFALCSIYFIKIFANSLLTDSVELINSEFLNSILYYAVAYLIGVISISNLSKSKFAQLLYNDDDVKEEPISVVFEKTNEQV